MTDELRQGGKLGSNELVLRIGRGGMATVWVARERARDQDRLVAVKAMLLELADDPEFVKMFRDEVRLVRAIRHPNVVEVHDVGEEDGVMWMSMEWVEGESLHTVIAEAGKRRAIPAEMAVRIIADVASGLHAAHELRDEQGQSRGVVHRDISPHNILIGADGAIKLVDFGVAKAVGRASEATRVGQLKGKFGYMSPEQARGQPVDRRSDVFSLGIVLFEPHHRAALVPRRDRPADPRARDDGPGATAHQHRSELPARARADRADGARARPRQALPDSGRARERSARLPQGSYMVVPKSGIAAPLKRVVGDRIEQRRKAVRAALRALGQGAAAVDLLSSDPAFTPTGGERGSRSGISAVSGPSAPQIGPAPWLSPPRRFRACRFGRPRFGAGCRRGRSDMPSGSWAWSSRSWSSCSIAGTEPSPSTKPEPRPGGQNPWPFRLEAARARPS